MNTNPLGPEIFSFFTELSANNRREWFLDNKERYELEVLDPALRFVSEFGPRLREVSSHFEALPKKVGGSVFRIYRDVRFSKDKTPYKTHLGIRFRHRLGKEVNGPVFYLHLEPDHVFAAAGMYRPHRDSLQAVRHAIVERPKDWRRAIADKGFTARFDRRGDTLKRIPRGFDQDHDLAEDLKRKDHIAICDLDRKEVLSADFPDRLAEIYRSSSPLMAFLCRAVNAPF